MILFRSSVRVGLLLLWTIRFVFASFLHVSLRVGYNELGP